MSERKAIVDWATEIFEDLSFAAARSWLADKPGRKATGFLPVYAPREIILAAGMLPMGIWGGGDRIEIIKGDAFYQSYICHLPRSVIELAQSKRLDFLSGMLFPSTCDVIRNLSGIWTMLYPDVYTRYLDVPQVLEPETGGRFWETELRAISHDLARIAGSRVDDDSLRHAIATYNAARELIRALYDRRVEAPWSVPTAELYVLMRAGEVVPVEVFCDKLQAYLRASEAEPGRVKDRARVVVMGAFCEQPPLGLIKTIEAAGCYIVDDDFILGNRFLTDRVDTGGDPFQALAQGFIKHAMPSSVVFEADPHGKRRLAAARVKRARAEGIIFAAPSFCDPALLDRPMLAAGAEADKIPTVSFRYAENSGQFQQFGEQAGTFADSIKLWGAA
ncbi:MAG: benzoyl-CoA reductase subunit C [Deltaproteobacteria bacterium]|nr:benzoyl-CoA reductase subunit C [Deltaproteobacteria bacterium]